MGTGAKHVPKILLLRKKEAEVFGECHWSKIVPRGVNYPALLAGICG